MLMCLLCPYPLELYGLPFSSEIRQVSSYSDENVFTLLSVKTNMCLDHRLYIKDGCSHCGVTGSFLELT